MTGRDGNVKFLRMQGDMILSGFEYSKVTDKLFVGSMISSRQDIDHLIEVGVTHIINACHEHNYQPLMDHYAEHISYCYCPELDDGFFPKPVGWFQRAIEFAETADHLYVHCVAGLNRSTSLTYAILRSRGMTGEGAKALIEEKRPVVVTDGGLSYIEDAELALEMITKCPNPLKKY
jgi:protein-tyrosine phosphatase